MKDKYVELLIPNLSDRKCNRITKKDEPKHIETGIKVINLVSFEVLFKSKIPNPIIGKKKTITRMRVAVLI